MSIKTFLMAALAITAEAALLSNQTRWTSTSTSLGNETQWNAMLHTNDTHVARNRTRCITDHLMFKISLPEFSDRRNRLHPPSVSWESDGCTKSANNPFGFPFLPACHRHDFGYENFRIEHRFTAPAKKAIDDKFSEDLYFQCDSVWAKVPCRALADVYYAAVLVAGGRDAARNSKRQDKRQMHMLIEAYERAVLAYNREVERAQAAGKLPLLPDQNGGMISRTIM